MPQGHLILQMRRQLEGGEWLSQHSDPAPPKNGCLPREGLSCPFSSLVLPTSAWTTQNSASVCSAQCGVGGQSLPDSGAQLCRCASYCLSQTKHQEKPRGGFRIKCPPDGMNKRLWKCPGAWGFQKDSFQGRWPLRREASCYVPACQGRKGPQASSGSAAPLCRRGGRFVGGSRQGQRRGEEAAPASAGSLASRH